MEDWQKRVLDERSALWRRLLSLRRFLSDKDRLTEHGVSDEENRLMSAQKCYMSAYLDALDKRIAGWPE